MCGVAQVINGMVVFARLAHSTCLRVHRKEESFLGHKNQILYCLRSCFRGKKERTTEKMKMSQTRKMGETCVIPSLY
jgi:hypothetical protein